ncbi:sacsin N-terminal ATP-binding-like domain-containing protein [Rubrivirga sp. IMCC43871]|uniref:sacsin N-terminal ATP-binding-like domain-containing protein n=1 Tax=Rubrivirga sp. IMCC43871 TaxID=3391575 RepID=UPI00398FA224
MLEPPGYFERVRLGAHRRWEQLEADPDLAAPWHQLFRQVQSPRHVISELLQNADDAGASWARAEVRDGAFIFEHDGADFDEDAFQSLCRFGFSNKRHLHTIGFRGIGFKSTFSVGPLVELTTPTLRVTFDKRRFTEPVWDGQRAGVGGATRVRIPVEGDDVEAWLNEELARWAADPLPILFFQNLRRLELQGVCIARDEAGPGPIPGSSWVALTGESEQRVLRIASEEVAFPADALEEVRAERGDPDFDLPPCRVELVVGAPDPRLYVVLPTEVRVDLPFACNAPFLQDPARTGIKDPTGSPTNRWLLRRVGALAAQAMLGWVGNGELLTGERAEGYTALLSEVPLEPVRSLAYDVAETVRQGQREALRGNPLVLTSKGTLAKPRAVLDIPPDLLDVWPEEVVLDLFGAGQTAVVAPNVPRGARARLASWKYLGRFLPEAFLDRLRAVPAPPQPMSDAALAVLWAFVGRLLGQQRHRLVPKGALAIVPAVGREWLSTADAAVVAGAAADRLSAEDWAFIGGRVAVVDPSWTARMLDPDVPLAGAEADAAELYRRVGLDQRGGLHEALVAVASAVFGEEVEVADGLRVGWIAAKADLESPPELRFLCDDGAWRRAEDGLLVDAEQALRYFPLDWAQRHLVSARYGTNGGAREHAVWQRWSLSPRSRLRRFVLPQEVATNVYGKSQAERVMVQRGGRKPDSYRLKSRDFVLADFDFDKTLWEGWAEQARDDDGVWPVVVRGICDDWDANWEKRTAAMLRQEGNQYSYSVEHGDLVAAWVRRLRMTPCLPDTAGRLRLPAELYRMNAKTAHLVGVEPFLAEAFDTEVAGPLLVLLGVRDVPDSLDRLIDRVRALSGTEVPEPAVRALYEALDRSMRHVAEGVVASAREAFSKEPLIRDAAGGWRTSKGVHQRNDDALPGLAVLSDSLAGLRLWDRLGVPVEPTADSFLDWLRSLPDGEAVRDGATVRAVLSRYPDRVWAEVGAWLGADGVWRATDAFQYASAQPDVMEAVFPGVRREVADVTMLPPAVRARDPFRRRPLLEVVLTYSLQDVARVGSAQVTPWLEALGRGLAGARPVAEMDPEEVARRREAGARMARTRWQRATAIDARPVLDGQPVGPSRAYEVLWVGKQLVATDEGPRVYAALVGALSAPIDEPALARAVDDCAGRDPAWIAAYFDAHFTLDGLGPGEPDPEAPGETADPEASDGTGPPSQGSPAGGEPDDAVEENPADDEEAELVPKTSRRTGPSGAELGYWRVQGFTYDEDRRRYDHPGGASVQRMAGSPFPWVAYDEHGDLQGRYWVSRRPLSTGVEVPAEVWDLLRRSDGTVALLIPSESGGLRCLDWGHLERLQSEGSVNLYPASYRLVASDS